MYRKDFPILKKYVYLDSTGSGLKPKQVVSAISQFYLQFPVNNHNLDSPLGIKIAQTIKKTRQQIASLVDGNENEVIFTSGATDSLNKIVNMFKTIIKLDDEIILSPYNHDSNLIPWIELCNEKKCKIVYAVDPVNAINAKTRIISYAQQNNTLQKYIDRKVLITKAHEKNIIVVNDAVQAIVHEKVSLKENDVIVLSGNKFYGPTGIGALIIKSNLLKQLNPSTFGGGAVNDIEKNCWISKQDISRFEPGTLNLAGICGWSAAIDYLKNRNLYENHGYEIDLAKFAYDKLQEVSGIKIYSRRGDLNIMFNIKNYSSQDVTSYLGHRKIIVRGGIHCAHLLNKVVKVDDAIRVSIAFYNNKQDITDLVKTLHKGGDFLDII